MREKRRQKVKEISTPYQSKQRPITDKDENDINLIEEYKVDTGDMNTLRRGDGKLQKLLLRPLMY